ncbi:MAG: acetyl-CoA C-acetyltransferase [Saprospiraceae bacterium]|jgi:acetyl-CoA C-acetyltransferase
MINDPIVIVSSARTAMGSLQGVLAPLSASELGAAAIKASVDRSGIDTDLVGEVIMGNVLSAGQGQAPARQAALGAYLPLSTTCSTINKMCGSGMKAAMLAHDSLVANSNHVMIAGGMESMSNAPYLLPKVRDGLRMGHGEVIDHMFFDGLEDAYDKGKLMGVFAESCADKYTFTREQQDSFAIRSLNRAIAASEAGYFDEEIIPVAIATRKGETVVSQDESPLNARIDKIPQLRPAFRQDGTVTAANASSISDGAAALLMMRESKAKALGLTPQARILGHASHSHEPQWFTTAPVGAMKKLLQTLNWQASDVDLFEINEAFAVVTMAAIEELSLDVSKVNIHGGACAMGHPIGASGARILVTLINALKTKGESKGIAALCIGGGEATAMAIELVN